MKRLISLLLGAALLCCAFPAFPVVPAAVAADRLPTPKLIVQGNTLYISENMPWYMYYPAQNSLNQKYDFALIRMDDFSEALLDECNVDDVYWLPEKAVHLYLSPDEVTTGSKKYADRNDGGAKPVSMQFGDFLLAREVGDGSTFLTSAWQVMEVGISMLSPSTAISKSDIPAPSLTDDSITLNTKQEYTRYEYAIVPNDRASSFVPLWLSLGSHYERGDPVLSAKFLPMSKPYRVYVRVQGDPNVQYNSGEKRPDYVFTGYFQYKSGITVTQPKVLYGLEKIGPLDGGNGGTTWYLSYDKGKKWQTIEVDAHVDEYIDLSKIFGKKEVPYVLRRAELIETEEEANPILTGPNDSRTLLEGVFKSRPVFGKEYIVSACAGGRFWQNWTLTGGKVPLEYSPDSGATWIPFIYTVGLPVLTASEQRAKVKPADYLIRIAANEATSTPGSVPRKFKQIKQVKAPTAKPDYKKEVLKLKAGLRYYIGESAPDMGTAVFTEAKGEPVPIDTAITNKQTIYVYVPENGKKARSAIQSIVLARREIAPDEGEGLIVAKNSVKMEKGFEFFGSKGKWGSFSKGDTSGKLRRKSTAKYNAKTNTNIGLAASRAVNVKISYPADKKVPPDIVMEAKKVVPLGTWGLDQSSTTNINITSPGILDSVTKTEPANEDAKLVVIEPKETAGFTIRPGFAEDDRPLVASIGVSVSGRAVTAANGYTVDNMSVGDVLTLTITPRDRDTYKISTATITVVNPRLEIKPSEVKIIEYDYEVDDEEGIYKGQVTIHLENPIGLGENYTLYVDLFHNGTLLQHKPEPVTHDPSSDYTVILKGDKGFRELILKNGPGDYRVEAYFRGNDVNSESAHAFDTATFVDRDFGPRLVDLDYPEYPKPGDAITVNMVKDYFGNDLRESCVYEWWRYPPTGSPGAIFTVDSDGAPPRYETNYYYAVTTADPGSELAVRIAKRMPSSGLGYGTGWGLDPNPNSPNNNGSETKSPNPNYIVCFPIYYNAYPGRFEDGTVEGIAELVERIYTNSANASVPPPSLGDPVRSGWIFDGWYENVPGDWNGGPIDTTILQELTLKAAWRTP